jgi:hypothetical protein
MRYFIFITVFLLKIIPVFSQEISFYQEDITMEIEEGYFTVHGSYNFSSIADQTTHFLYPFPSGPIYGKVDSIHIFNTNKAIKVKPTKTTDRAVLFRIELERGQTTEVQVFYRQKLLGNRAEYILESTRSWGKPLKEASYQLIVPKTLQVEVFSYPPQDSILTDDKRIYFWHMSDFLPAHNMEFTFLSPVH